MKRRVLLTGANGRVGRAFRAGVDDRYDLRLVDRDLYSDDSHPVNGNHVIACDLSDLDSCYRVCADMDVVLHLAADHRTHADFYGSLLDNNIKCVYNIFRAAKDQGCQRVIFASSIQVVAGYPLDVQPTTESPIKPMNMYAACKAFGEATAYYFAHAEGLSSIAVRVGGFEGNHSAADVASEEYARTVDGRQLSAFISKRDMNHLFVQCIETPDLQFAIVHAVSDNRFKRMDITSTRDQVDYQPKDDAFKIFQSGIRYRERWYVEDERRSK